MRNAEKNPFPTVSTIEEFARRDPVLRHLLPIISGDYGRRHGLSHHAFERLLLAIACRIKIRSSSTPRSQVGGLSPSRVRRAMELISHPASSSPTCPAIELGLSPIQFTRAFKAATGFSPSAWQQQARVEQAKVYLRENRLPLADVAIVCGFSDQSHLTRIFKRITTMTPAAWRTAEALNPKPVLESTQMRRIQSTERM
jgi:AraC family transcriptional regulator